MVEFGLCNASLDETLYDAIKLENPSWKDDKIFKEMNDQKKVLTLFNEANRKSKSTKKPKKPKKDKK